jgi:AcrR family transcriptional regulator
MKFAAPPPDGPSLEQRAAGRSTADLVAARASEAQRLIDAGRVVMTRVGLERRATVAEIVREAGLSNQAFYRHFAGKDDLVATIVDANARRLSVYLEREMATVPDPIEQIRVWVRTVLQQAVDLRIAVPTRAVTANRNVLIGQADADARRAEAMVWELLVAPVAAIAEEDARRRAYLVGKLTIMVMLEALWSDEPPSEDELRFVVDFCVAAAVAPAPAQAADRDPD